MTPFDIMAPSLAKSAFVVRPPGPRELYKYSRLSKWIPESLAGVLHEEISTPFASRWPEDIRSVLGSFDHVHDPLLQILLRNLENKLLQEVKGHSLFSNTAFSLCPGGIVSGFQIRPEISDSFFNLKLDFQEIEAPAQPSITGFLVWIGEGLSADVCLEIISDPRKAHSVLILVVAEKDSRTDLNLIISGSG
ncbi:MAG: hypothetical protein N2050_06885, partial [Flavobacteriales bacterium]|nr:hypothetical protein [Flavobacteriales bacterium]